MKSGPGGGDVTFVVDCGTAKALDAALDNSKPPVSSCTPADIVKITIAQDAAKTTLSALTLALTSGNKKKKKKKKKDKTKGIKHLKTAKPLKSPKSPKPLK
jgi:hypothetical protein